MILCTILASIATALALAGVGLHVAALGRLRRHLAPRKYDVLTLPPVTHWRTVKAGVPNLAAKIEALLSAVDPGDEVLIGVDAGSAEAALCAQVAARYPGLTVRIVPCEPNHAKNPKISKLQQMEPFAQHEHWILTDSEVEMDPAMLRAFREEWAAEKWDAITAGYRFTSMRSIPQALDAGPVLLTLWPGLMHAPKIDFTLGACSGVRREHVAEIGGWAMLGEELAEDRQLGLKLVQRGHRVGLSREVVSLESDAPGWWAWLKHQHRVAVTYRKATPAGTLGMPIIHALPLALCAGALGGGWWWLVPALVYAMRVLLAGQMARLLRFPIPLLPAVVLIATMVEAICWVLAWLPLPVWWAGRWRWLR